MRIEQHIVAAWANRLENRLISDAISAFQEMQDSSLLSGDSGLTNVWEEICVQVQYEASAFWSAYAETIEHHFSARVSCLAHDERMALWAITNEGWDYIYDHREAPDGADHVPVADLEIVLHLKSALLTAAADYSNARIEKFLERHEVGYDELDEDDDTFDEATNVDDAVTDLMAGVYDPIYLVLSRQQIEVGDTDSALDFLRSLVPNDDPSRALAFKGRVSLHVSGYDLDTRELFEIPEVRRYLQSLDEEWPFWFFFLSQADESLKVLAMCLCSSTAVAPGQTRMDPDDFARFWERGVDAMGFLFHTYEYRSADGEALLMQIARFFANGQSPMGPDNCSGSAL